MTRTAYAKAIEQFDPVVRSGSLQRIFQGSLEADGPNVPLGTLCAIEASDGTTLTAEVVRVDTSGVRLAPLSRGAPLAIGARVVATEQFPRLPVGDTFLGRAIDALGEPLDGLPSPIDRDYLAFHVEPPPPMARAPAAQMMVTGIRAIDGLLPLGQGQRVGIFAASGVGKTSLMSQIMHQAEADICVVCLVGERGREVEAIWSDELNGQVRARTALVAATSDQPAALRIRAVHQALALARYWRDQGKHVLFVLDSVTRFAMALREVGLAAGEPPTIRAYTPNVFGVVPQIIEQCGALAEGGAISAILTVLSETDDIDDPISEMMKSLLDGHIVLARSLAETGHFPAIDVVRSVSRNAHTRMAPGQADAARQVHAMLSVFDASRLLVESGIYVSGSNPSLDRAIAARSSIETFLKQNGDAATLDETVSHLRHVAGL